MEKINKDRPDRIPPSYSREGIRGFGHFPMGLLWVLVLGALATFYFFVNPAEWGWMPQCLFHKLSGLQCMGCGSQRMLHALLHGDLVEAFRLNAFLFCSLPFIGFLVLLEFKRLRWPELYRRVHSRAMIITTAAMLGAWLLVRNIMGI
ncbi:MAG: DUF2752 domain-containing protein [Muribaculaceae bacterium]|nr:DUF2752 domain-containing protein [Muribaculaceae bacterium]